MKNLKVSRKNAASMIAVLCICLLLVTMVGFLFSDSIDNFANHLNGYLGLKMEPRIQEEAFTPDQRRGTKPYILGACRGQIWRSRSSLARGGDPTRDVI